jgi:hypothetical protein
MQIEANSELHFGAWDPHGPDAVRDDAFDWSILIDVDLENAYRSPPRFEAV